MTRVTAQGRSTLAGAACALGAGLIAGLLSATPAAALDPARGLTQFHHTSWSRQDGIPGQTNVLAQTPDGFLWIGAPSGLYRFDGVRADRFADGRLPDPEVLSLAASDDGDLWAGLTNATVARVRGGKLTRFAAPAGGSQVLYLAPEGKGAVWVGLRDRVFHFDGQRWRSIASPWPPASTYAQPGGVWAMALARDGTLWAKNLLGLYHLRRGAAAFERTAGYGGGLVDFARDREGRLWTADFQTRRFYVLPDLAPGRPVPPPLQVGEPVPASILGTIRFDRDGTLWNANRVTGGLHRLGSVTSPAQAERFVPRGRTMDLVLGVIEDREGAIWVASEAGLDRFRPANIVPETTLPVRAQAAGIVATKDAVFVYSGMAARVANPTDPGRRLYRIRAGQAPEVVASDIGQLQALAAAPEGDLVMAREDRLLRWRDGKFTRIAVAPEMEGAHVANLAASPNQGLLVALHGKGVWRLESDRWSRISPPSARPGAYAEVAVDSAGAAWLFYRDSLIVRVVGQRMIEFPRSMGAQLGVVEATLADRDGLIIVANGGLARFDGRTLQILPAARLPALAPSVGIGQTPGGDVWLLSEDGVLRLHRAALLKAFANPAAPLEPQLFDVTDGFGGPPPGDVFNNSMTAGPDGRIWFLAPNHPAWIDPRRLYRNTRPPPVVIRSATANGRRHDMPTTLTLAAGTSQLQVDYTALSLAAPERVRFRYRLEGVDRTWVEAGARRQAFYTNLEPGSYRFQVIAANGDGVWNTTGATLGFDVRPTFWQTWVFKGLLTLLALAALWLLYRLRLRQVGDRIRARLAERMDERERIARELHDTLLQSFQGLSLKLQAFAEQMPPGQPARELMEQALDRADEALAEGRDRVRNLRASDAAGDLPAALAAAVERLHINPTVEVSIGVEGARRALHPVVFDEVLAVAGEALFNAFNHAHADHVRADVAYERNQLVIRIRDDGVGIDEQVLRQGREGHFGLAGMRERARKIRGQLNIRSRPDSGTEVVLTVPAGHAYAQDRRWRPFAPRRLELED